MLKNSIHVLLTTMLLSAVVLCAPAATRAADVADAAGFFSAGAVAKANRTIAELERKSGHQIRIETYATVPSDKAEAVAKMDKTQRETFFSNWLHDRAEVTKSHGIFILICKEPAHLRVWGGNSIQRAGFSTAQATPVREALLTGFRTKDYDRALDNAVVQLGKAFDGLHKATNGTAAVSHGSVPNRTIHSAHEGNPTHAGNPAQEGPHPANQQTGFGGLLFVMAIIIGGIFLFSFISRMFAGSRSGPGYGGPGYGPAPGGGGGGGFLSGLTGGIFGAVAGNYLYDQFSGRHASGGDIRDHSSAGGLPDSGSPDSGSSGGTDFGGGDFGGSGDGGGDLGGGDDF